MICFFDLINKKILKKINNINIRGNIYDNMLMISNDLLLIAGENKISIINVNSYNLIRAIDVPNSNGINAVKLLNKNILLNADWNKRIIQWKIDGDNLQLISKKLNAHNGIITTLSIIGNGLIISGSWDKSVKIW